MNHIYRLVWNEEHQDCVPAPETARRRGKRGSKKADQLVRAAASVLLGLFLALPVLAQPVWAQPPIGPHTLPTGGEVIHGQANISQNANQMHINQGSDKAILHWQGFDIGQKAKVDFAQPSTSSVALNRVVAGDASQIHGQLTANGQVWLVNPKGVVFGQGSRVDVGGLVATTLDTTNQDFLDGKMNFTRGDATGSITNQGEITAAEGGLVALLAPEIINDGLVSAQMGTVVMAGGDRVSLDAGMNGMLKVAVDASTVDSLIENRQMVKADGGQVIMTSKAATELVSSVITNKGTVQARTMVEKNGRILLLADMDHGQVHQAGTLDASAPISGDGGFVETSAATVQVADGSKVTTRAETGQSGTWLIDPNDYTIGAGGNISGATLSDNLAGGSVIIDTANGGTSGGNGDIHVNDDVSWSQNRLTLTAERGININAVMTASGSSELEMNTGTGDVKVGFKEGEAQGFAGRVDFGTRTGDDFLTINSIPYMVINSLGDEGSTTGTDLQGMQGDLSGHYALGADIDASDTATWDGDAGFTPITPFEGTFNGLGHVIENLTIDRSAQDDVGLFGYSTGKISNVGLEGGSVTGKNWVGGLVGENWFNNISNSYATGTVTGTGNNVGGLVGDNWENQISNSYATGLVTGNDKVGGLVGNNDAGQITNSHAIGAVTGNEDVGGLVGHNHSNAQISTSYTTGAVTGNHLVGGLVGWNQNHSDISTSYAIGAVTGSGDFVGGLVGWNEHSDISTSYATGAVTGNGIVGGLVGDNLVGNIRDSYATGLVTGNEDDVGGLVGYNFGDIANSYATGAVTGTGDYVGGLVGQNYEGDISDSHATGAVEGTGDYVGGLAGYNGDKITNSHATGAVTGTGDYVGGLVGYNCDKITNSHATGAVTGNAMVGGLVGHNYEGDITNSHATGAVEGTGNYVGGLVGYNGDKITNSQATGAVTGTGSWYVGGLVGYNCDKITNSHATGAVTGNVMVGGLVGQNTGTIEKSSYTEGEVTGGWIVGGLVGYNIQGEISNSYATGKVTGNDIVGGLVGYYYEGEISNSYATGEVTGNNWVGGLVGDNEGNADGIRDCFWDTETSGLATSAGGEGKTTEEMKTLSTFSGWDIAAQGGENTIWRIYEGDSYPLLRSFMTPHNLAGVTVNNDSKTYSGIAYSGGNGLSGFTEDMAHVFYGGSAQGAINAGSYTIAIYSDQQGYDFIGNPTGSLTIDQAPLTATASQMGTVQKIYDGTKDARLETSSDSENGISGWVAGEGAIIHGEYDTKDVGFDKNVSFVLEESKFTPTGTTNLANYFLPGGSISGDVGVINPASLTVTANGDSKTYDGQAYNGGNGVDYSGFVAGETASVLDGTLTYSGTSQGAIDAGTYTITPEGLTSTNYAITFVNGRLTINQAPIEYITIYGRLTGTVQKAYDGTTEATLAPENYVLTGWVAGQGAQVTKTRGSYDNANVGTGKLVTVSLTNADYAPTGSTDLGNYDLPTSISGNVGVIDPASLTVTANDAAKTYDGLAYSGGNGVDYSGFVAGETASVLGGTLTYSGTSQGARDVGSYAITPGGYTSTNYMLDYVDGTLTISPAVLTAILGSLTGTVQKTYDGTMVATLAPENYVLTGWQNSDGAQVTKANGSYDNANAGTGKMVTISLMDADYAPIAGTNLHNYILPTSISGNVGVIDPASLTVAAHDAAKTYDGLAYSGGNGVDYSGFVAGETASVLDGALTYGGTSQGAKDAGSYIITPGGYTARNYILNYVDGQLVIKGGPVHPDNPGTQQAPPASGSLWTAFSLQGDGQNSGPQGRQEADSFNRGQTRPLLSFAPHFIRLNDEEEEEQEL